MWVEPGCDKFWNKIRSVRPMRKILRLKVVGERLQAPVRTPVAIFVVIICVVGLQKRKTGAHDMGENMPSRRIFRPEAQKCVKVRGGLNTKAKSFLGFSLDEELPGAERRLVMKGQHMKDRGAELYDVAEGETHAMWRTGHAVRARLHERHAESCRVSSQMFDKRRPWG